MKRPNINLPDLRRILQAPARADRPLLTERIDGHLQVTKTSTWGWYRYQPAPWAYGSTVSRTQLLDRVAYAYAALPDRAVKIRVSSRPVDAARIASDFHLAARKAHMKGTLPEPAYSDYVAGVQKRITDIGLLETVAMIGVRLDDHVKDLADVTEANAEVLSALSARGIEATPMSSADMEWLMHQSIAPGIVLPDGPRGLGTVFDESAVGSFTDQVVWECAPFGQAVKVIARRGGETRESWVSVLTVARMQDRDFPEDGSLPWVAAAAQQAFPVDVVVAGTIRRGRDLKDQADLWRRYSEDQINHHADHGEKPPASVERSAVHASEIYDEMATGTDVDANRWIGVAHLVVHGETYEECTGRARRLTKSYGEKLRISLELTRDQPSALRVLVPGEPWGTLGYQHQLPVRYLAAAVPNVTGQVGTPTGMYLGYTSGDVPRRVVLHDWHYSQMVLNHSGVYPILASLGAGKSALIGLSVYVNALAGNACWVLDPAGPLARLCELPELKPHSRHLDLSSARPGILDPRRLIPLPSRERFDDPDDWEAEVGRVHAQRNSLLVDVLKMLLPWTMQQRDGTDDALDEAVMAAEADPWKVIEQLRARNHTGIANHIEGAARGYARLMFPDQRHPDIDLDDGLDTATLTVVTMSGLQTPEPGLERADWTSEQRVGAAVMHLAAFHANRFIAVRRPGEPKIIAIDEVHILAHWPSGRAFVASIVRNTRKLNIALILGSQHPHDIQRLDPEGRAFTGGGFIGRQELDEVAAAALDTFGLPNTDVHRAEVMALTEIGPDELPVPGEFLYVDPYGRVECVRIDIRWLPDLFDALNTTPDGER